MADRLHLGTRKGLITFKRGATGWATERTSFLGDSVTMVLPDARDQALYAGLNLGHFGVKLRRSRDGGENWDELAVPEYPEGATIGALPETDDAPPAKVAALSYIWSLESAGPDRPGELWAGTIPGGLFHSADHGDSWTLVESLWNCEERRGWFGGGMDDPGIHSICVDPRDSKHVSLGISCGGVWVTRDAGESWQLKAKGMRAAYMPPDQAYEPNIQDPHRLVLCPAAPDVYWVQHHNGVFRSSDDCENWIEFENVVPSEFGFAVAVHPQDPDTAWFAPAVKDECRVPVDGKVVVTRTTDGGKTFETFSEGLPAAPAYDIVFRHCLEVDEDGTTLAMGSSTGSLWISEDSGESWQLVSAHLPQIYSLRFG